jgi:hypothetical protein
MVEDKFTKDWNICLFPDVLVESNESYVAHNMLVYSYTFTKQLVSSKTIVP